MRMLLALALLAAPAAGAPVAPAALTPGDGRPVVAGTTVSLSLPAVEDADEMELVLSLDGGATFPIRVTGEIAPGATLHLWRVPNLPSAEARLALRAGSEAGESIRAVGALFRIEASAHAGLEDATRRSGEWKTREARSEREDARGELPAAGLNAPSPRLDRLVESTDAEDATSVFLPIPKFACETRAAVAVCEPAAATSAADVDAPRTRPLRE